MSLGFLKEKPNMRKKNNEDIHTKNFEHEISSVRINKSDYIQGAFGGLLVLILFIFTYYQADSRIYVKEDIHQCSNIFHSNLSYFNISQNEFIHENDLESIDKAFHTHYTLISDKLKIVCLFSEFDNKTFKFVPASYHGLPPYCCGSHLWMQFCGCALIGLISYLFYEYNTITKILIKFFIITIIISLTWWSEDTYWWHAAMFSTGVLYGIFLIYHENVRIGYKRFPFFSLLINSILALSAIIIYFIYRNHQTFEIISSRSIHEILHKFPLAILLQRGGLWFCGVYILMLTSTSLVECLYGKNYLIIIYIFALLRPTIGLFEDYIQKEGPL